MKTAELVEVLLNLCNADLRGANLYNADLNEANPSGTNLGDIPVVPRLESRIWEMVRRDKKALRMSAWHTCETTHCRAGWAIHLAGAAGAELERRLGPAAAGALIYHRSCGYVPNFYTSDEEALADIQRRAAEENETP